MPLGYLFGETSNDTNDPRRRKPGQFSSGLSDAIRVLSLRLPSVLGGGRPIAPEDLLRPQVGGRAGQPRAVASSVLRSTGTAEGPAALPPEAGVPATLASPAAQPFGMLRPSSGEAPKLNALVGDALGAPSPGVHIGTQEPGEDLPPNYPLPGPPNEPPASPGFPSTPVTPWLGPNSTTAPVGSGSPALENILDVLMRLQRQV
jgi:hypothetical protein